MILHKRARHRGEKMKMRRKTTVVNLMDDRAKAYALSPDEAVIAAYEQFENGNYNFSSYLPPGSHPRFKEYRKGYACGDWIAWKKSP